MSTLIDYYGIPASYGYPAWEEARGIQDPIKRMDGLEEGMHEDVNEELRGRFIPYIQLHEFEGLLFSDVNGFDALLPEDEYDCNGIATVIAKHPNPELINNDPSSAPSKRLGALVKGYSKVLYGSLLAEAIGLATIRQKAVRFNDWVAKLEKLG